MPKPTTSGITATPNAVIFIPAIPAKEKVQNIDSISVIIGNAT